MAVKNNQLSRDANLSKRHPNVELGKKLSLSP